MKEHIARWKQSGSDEDLLGYAMTLFTNPSNELIPPVLQLINAVAFAALDHELTHAEAAGFLCRLAGQQPETTATSSDVITLIVDMFWVTEVQYETCNPEKLGDLHALARAIIAEGFVPETLMKERWEIPFLEKVGLISNAQLFLKRVVRINTAQSYKQHKFNLLREESEGYSKLITLLSSGTADDQDDATTAYKAKTVLDEVMALIAYFDLDPNRVLAIALDIFAANIVTHYRFFIKFLRISPWDSRSTDHGFALQRGACAHVLGFNFQDLQ
ncbi:THO complex subunit 2, partial [Mortierella sp. GBA43]